MFKPIASFFSRRKPSPKAEETPGQDEKLPPGKEAEPVPDVLTEAPLLPEENQSIEEKTAEWKQQAVLDFGQWLDTLADDHPIPGKAPDETCDLFTLFSEFSALRQEVRMQNREQHKSLKTLEKYSNIARENADVFNGLNIDYSQAVEKVDKLCRDLNTSTLRMQRKYEENLHREIEKRTLLPFLDIRDALVRGLQAAREAAAPKYFFWEAALPKRFTRKPVKGIEGVIEGYEMAVRRFDRAMASVGVVPVHAKGKRFDPAVMRAIQTESRERIEKGIVLEELLGGYIRGDEVIRTAEVIVNE